MDDYSGNIDQQLINAYRATIYKVFKPTLSLKIGQKNDELDTFLIDNNTFTWAFISACNPFSQKLSDKENDLLHKKLYEELVQNGYRICEGEGQDEKNDWPPEKSYLVLQISKKNAFEIAKTFDQNAIIFGQFNKAPELILLR